MKIKIREAVELDLSIIYDLIKELAEFEKEPNEPTITLSQFSKDFRSQFICIVAEDQETLDILGIALYYWGYSTWKGKMLYLDDLVVKLQHRQKRIGAQLFNEIVQIAKKEEANQIRWQVLDWNQPAIEMYQKVKADFHKDWWTCKLEIDKIKNYHPI